MRGVTRIKRIIRNTRRLTRPVAVILIYHRVIDLPVDVHNITVSPHNFARHLEAIRAKYTPMTLGSLADAMRSDGMPHRSVVVTFDDGYSDNFCQAKPLLEAYQVPATIFVVSGGVDSAREFWWDDLERIFRSTANLPRQLSITIEGEPLCLPITNQEQRQDALKAVHMRLRRMSFIQREKVLGDLARWAGIGSNGRLENLPMQSDALCLAAQSKYIEIGAHTKTHPVLSALSTEEQRAEIIESQLALETLLRKPVRTFSYPYGNPEDFTPQTIAMVKSAGFTAAVTTVQGAVAPGDDLFQLKRCEVNNWDVETFRRKLDSFFYA